MFSNAVGAEFRRFENRDHDGEPARVVVAERTYDTDRADLWDALTNPDRIPRWFLPIDGDLKPGGRYQLEGNAGGSITRCDPPEAFDLTWEMGGGTSWVTVRLEAQGDRTLLTLEHIVRASDVDEHWAQFGPGAVGVGWDLAMFGMSLYLAGAGGSVDRGAVHKWMTSEDGKAFMRASAEAWCAAHVKSGEDPETAKAMAERTVAAYTGG